LIRMEESIRKARKNMESKDRKKEAKNRRNRAPHACTPHHAVPWEPFGWILSDKLALRQVHRIK
ncbi:hypothetical protein PIB30_100314, partial [Stylosanthes scabra]|nr:hypothetical protein [Stylosanthes scabra]